MQGSLFREGVVPGPSPGGRAQPVEAIRAISHNISGIDEKMAAIAAAVLARAALQRA